MPPVSEVPAIRSQPVALVPARTTLIPNDELTAEAVRKSGANTVARQRQREFLDLAAQDLIDPADHVPPVIGGVRYGGDNMAPLC